MDQKRKSTNLLDWLRVRINTELKQDFNKVCKKKGTKASREIRNFMQKTVDNDEVA